MEVVTTTLNTPRPRQQQQLEPKSDDIHSCTSVTELTSYNTLTPNSSGKVLRVMDHMFLAGDREGMPATQGQGCSPGRVQTATATIMAMIPASGLSIPLAGSMPPHQPFNTEDDYFVGELASASDCYYESEKENELVLEEAPIRSRRSSSNPLPIPQASLRWGSNTSPKHLPNNPTAMPSYHQQGLPSNFIFRGSFTPEPSSEDDSNYSDEISAYSDDDTDDSVVFGVSCLQIDRQEDAEEAEEEEDAEHQTWGGADPWPQLSELKLPLGQPSAAPRKSHSALRRDYLRRLNVSRNSSVVSQPAQAPGLRRVKTVRKNMHLMQSSTKSSMKKVSSMPQLLHAAPVVASRSLTTPAVAPSRTERSRPVPVPRPERRSYTFGLSFW